MYIKRCSLVLELKQSSGGEYSIIIVSIYILCHCLHKDYIKLIEIFNMDVGSNPTSSILILSTSITHTSYSIFLIIVALLYILSMIVLCISSYIQLFFTYHDFL